MGKAVRTWLKQLASSDLRNHIGVEAKLAIAYESPPGWDEFHALSRALKEGNAFAAKEVAKEKRAVLAGECIQLLQLYAGNKQLRIPVPEFVRIATALELPKRFGSELSELAPDPQFRRYYEALLPALKKGAAGGLRTRAGCGCKVSSCSERPANCATRLTDRERNRGFRSDDSAGFGPGNRSPAIRRPRRSSSHRLGPRQIALARVPGAVCVAANGLRGSCHGSRRR